MRPHKSSSSRIPFLKLSTVKVLCVPALLLSLLCLSASPAAAKDFTLKAIDDDLTQNYTTIKHLPAANLAAALQAGKAADYLIFDVREPGEFNVSHIKGAAFLSPATWSSGFFKKYGSQIEGKKIIFYCSVGVRSSKMAAYLKDELMANGAVEVYNLKEGLFGWANEARPMVNKQGPTPYIHPYNDHWGQLIKSKDLWRQ